jgi:integrase
MGKRANGEGSIFRVGKSKMWKALLTVGRGPDGRMIRRSRTCKSQADARAALEELREEYAGSPQVSEVLPATVGQFLDFWLENSVRPNKSENTLTSYRIAADKHLKPRIGSIPLKRFSAAHVEKLVREMIDEETGGRARQNAFVVLRRAMNHAVKLRMIRASPCTAIEKPKHDQKKIHPFTADEAKRLLTCAAGTFLEALYYLAFATGMRQGELFGLRWSDVDLKRGRISIEQQATEISGNVTLGKPKTPSSVRTIEIPRAVADALVAHKARQLKAGKASAKLVFPARGGGYIHRGNFRTRHWAVLQKKAQVPYRGFHHVRHTYATLQLGAGVPVHVVSKILGHAKPSTTLNIYAHALESQQAAATTSISSILGCCPVATSAPAKSS